jgi:hypothetical protein
VVHEHTPTHAEKMCVPIEKFRFVLRKRAPGTMVEGLKAKKVRTTSDDAGAKSVTEKSKSTVI